MALASGPRDEAASGLQEVDRRLASVVVPEDEWEVLYRERLQIERDLLRDHQDGRDDGREDESRRPSLAGWLRGLVRGMWP